MTSKITIEEFRECGALWWVNQQLHLFGMALCVEIDESGSCAALYPAKCKFRGFDTKINDRGYAKLTKYMKDNAECLLNDCEE